MRVIAGSYRGRSLKSPPTSKVRPTSDRLRETLFNILSPRIPGARFLDLCAGSGAIGIEAISRGATRATFVDNSREMCTIIETNLNTLDISKDNYSIFSIDSLDFLRQRNADGQFDIVYFDPPYKSDYQDVLKLLGGEAGQLLASDALVIAEHFHKHELPEVVATLKRFRLVRQGDSSLSFYKFDHNSDVT